MLGASMTVSGSITCRGSGIVPPCQCLRLLLLKRAFDVHVLIQFSRRKFRNHFSWRSTWPNTLSCMRGFLLFKQCRDWSIAWTQSCWWSTSWVFVIVHIRSKDILPSICLEHLASRFTFERNALIYRLLQMDVVNFGWFREDASHLV